MRDGVIQSRRIWNRPSQTHKKAPLQKKHLDTSKWRWEQELQNKIGVLANSHLTANEKEASYNWSGLAGDGSRRLQLCLSLQSWSNTIKENKYQIEMDKDKSDQTTQIKKLAA
jgi:hypothetical protein